VRGGLAVLSAALLWTLLAGSAFAATLNVRATDRLELNAPAVTTFPVGTSAVVAAVGYQGVAAGSTIDFALVDASGNRVVTYSEPAASGGSGEVVARLIAPAALPQGTYRLQVAASGATAESQVTIGTPPPPTPTPAPAATFEPVPGATPGAAATPPVQLAAPQPNALLAARMPVPSGETAGRRAVNDPRFGLANVLPDGAGVPGQARSATVAWMTRARDAGAGGNRWELRWDRIEREPGRYDWGEVDAIVAANEAAGLPLLAILIGTPVWAADGRASSVPTGLDAPPVMPDGTVGERNVWGRFVHAAAQRYRGRIAAYEIWNEPNRPDFWGGTPEQYYRLLSAGMAAIRHADPNARVVLGGLDGYRNLEFLDRLLDVAAADPAPPGRRGAFDVLAWHAYHRPLDVYTGTLALRERLRARGLSQPIWLTETNVAAWDDRPVRGTDPRPYRWSARGDEQAAFVLETLAYAVAADVERIYLYRASDTGESEAWGLLQADGTPRPTEAAFRFATSALAGTTAVRRLGGEGIERIELERPGELVTLAWATGPRDAGLIVPSATGRPAVLRDKWGGIGSVEARDGRYVLSLPGASADQGAFPGDYFIGGDPYVVVESVP
jgi:hypothetical protein